MKEAEKMNHSSHLTSGINHSGWRRQLNYGIQFVTEIDSHLFRVEEFIWWSQIKKKRGVVCVIERENEKERERDREG